MPGIGRRKPISGNKTKRCTRKHNIKLLCCFILASRFVAQFEDTILQRPIADLRTG
jgi:membrane-anchored protein YejM (alkaline phosphatase superfamily)